MKKFISFSMAVILALFCLVSCAPAGADKEEGYYTRVLRSEMGRLCISLSTKAKDGTVLPEEKLKEIYDSACTAFAEGYRFLTEDEGSQLSAINANIPTVLDIDKKLLEEIGRAMDFSALTDGLYDPTAGSLTALLRSKNSPQSDELKDALSHVGSDKLTFSEKIITKADPLTRLDLYSWRDGYALRCACEYLKETETAFGTVTFNGIAGVFGEKPDGETFSVELGNGKSGVFNITDGYVALVCEGFGSAYDLSEGTLDPALSRCAVYAPTAEHAAVLASVGYSAGSDALLGLYEKEELTFEAVITEKDGKEVFTKNAKGSDLYTPITTAVSE
ncbi:MAG: FAD:protein FMN transferase [Clostridia bacterium]|nr:FAD:protein FMN transferase [Clostridia bacterium]